MPGIGTPCNLICKASAKPKSRQAIKAVLGCHFPNISAANAKYTNGGGSRAEQIRTLSESPTACRETLDIVAADGQDRNSVFFRAVKGRAVGW